MKNLAGSHSRTEEVQRELERLSIPVVNIKSKDHEVPSSITGLLKIEDRTLSISRHWSYFGVYGLVPYSLAEELYDNKVGQTDIRVAGHCGCPHPSEFSEWILPDGRKVIPTKQKEEFERYKDLLEGKLDAYVFHDTPEYLGAKRYVQSYHIDTELGMYIFVQAVNKYNKDNNY